MFFQLPPLPYTKNALKPYLSQETLEYHYDKHHNSYVNNLNKLIKNTIFENKSLEEIIKTAEEEIFNNAAQVWNHNFYWRCLIPGSNGKPSGKIANLIDQYFGNFEEFKKQFTNKAIKNFGSGWTWLVKQINGEFAIINTSNAITPIISTDKPLLTIDVWEHAYYIDYRNMRSDYLANFWPIVNWHFVEQNL